MATINSDGKVAYIYNQSNDTWYALGGAVNTNAEYTWTADQTFSSVVNFDMVANAKAGVNNFQNPTARDAAITSPSNGVVCFVRQTDAGAVINQIQYYYNGEWRWSGDSADISLKTANYTITKDDVEYPEDGPYSYFSRYQNLCEVQTSLTRPQALIRLVVRNVSADEFA
jgi:hypothetical protein